MAEHDAKKFKFTVDGKHFEVDKRYLSGTEIRALAQIDPNAGLFLESHGPDPDRQIATSDSIDLGAPGVEKFYSVPPATFGS